MQPVGYKPWLHNLAVATACVALLPIVVGALVTTMNAGMAFADWPSSDGHNMLTYPWLHSAGDKFLEHGHRLAGILVGIVSIVLAGSFLRYEQRRWVTVLAVLVLLGVILQGVLGGIRVRLDDPRLAMLHGGFAAIVFTLMAVVAIVTSRSWLSVAQTNHNEHHVDHLKPLVCLAPAIIFAQYLFGGQLRHLGRGLHEHLGFAFIALLFSLITVIVVWRTRHFWLRRSAVALAFLMIVQMLLGAASWVTKFGFAASGYVAVQNSIGQTFFRSSHMVIGMLVFMTSVILAVRVFRVSAIGRELASITSESQTLSSTFSVQGGTR